MPSPDLQSSPELLFLVVVVFAAGFINTLAGFGYGIIAMPLLVLLLDPKSAVVVTQISFLSLGPILAWSARRDVHRRYAATLLLSSFAGLPLGAYVLMVISESLLRLLIGSAVAVAALLILGDYRWRFRHERRAALLVGFVTGVLTSSLALSGPTTVLFLANQNLSKDALRATAAVFIMGMIPVSVVMLAVAGVVTGPLVATALPLVPACLLSYLLAIRLLPFLAPGLFRRIAIGLVLVAGVAVLASELRRLLVLF